MFSIDEKRYIAQRIENLLLELRHPEMPKVAPRFKLHVDGAEPWSWADIVDPTTAAEKFGPGAATNPWNEVARDVMQEAGG
jgi:hypothetical protein